MGNTYVQQEGFGKERIEDMTIQSTLVKALKKTRWHINFTYLYCNMIALIFDIISLKACLH